MALNNKNLSQLLAVRIAEAGAELAKPAMGSRTLVDATTVIGFGSDLKRDAQARIFIPHYWAVMVHNGHGEILPKRGEFLMWYANASQDHRFSVFRPVRLSDVTLGTPSRLSSEELTKKVKSGEIIMARRVRPKQGKFFFSNNHAMRPLKSQADIIAGEMLSAVTRQALGKFLNITDSASATL